MANTGYTTIRLRRDTTANWTSGTKNLAYGELGIDVTTGKLKFGNNSGGLQAWESAKDVAVFQADQATAATTATNLASGASGSIPYQSGAGTTTFVGIGGTGTLLTVSGGVPTWVKPKITTTYFDNTTTSADLAGVISDETGTGSLVFANNAALTTPTIGFQGLYMTTSGGGTVTLLAGAGASNYAITLPNETTATLLSAATAASTYVAFSGTQTITGNKTFSGTTVISGAVTLSNASVTLSSISGLPGSGTLPVQASSAGALSVAKVSLTSHVTGTLPLANGGLGATTVTGGRETLRIYVQSTEPSSPQVGDVWFW